MILTFLFIHGSQSKQPSITAHAFQLQPGKDLKPGIEKIIREKVINAGWVATCVGRLTIYSIRVANQQEGNTMWDELQIKRKRSNFVKMTYGNFKEYR